MAKSEQTKESWSSEDVKGDQAHAAQQDAAKQQKQAQQEKVAAEEQAKKDREAERQQRLEDQKAEAERLQESQKRYDEEQTAVKERSLKRGTTARAQESDEERKKRDELAGEANTTVGDRVTKAPITKSTALGRVQATGVGNPNVKRPPADSEMAVAQATTREERVELDRNIVQKRD